jgi:hypothetical protein
MVSFNEYSSMFSGALADAEFNPSLDQRSSAIESMLFDYLHFQSLSAIKNANTSL